MSIVYQKQQDTLIVWSDMDRRDMALSFQEKGGCDEIWEKICEVRVSIITGPSYSSFKHNEPPFVSN